MGIQAFADPLGIKDDKTEENVAKHENHIDDDDEFDGDDDFDDSELGEQGVQEDGKPVSGISTSRAMKIALEKVGGGRVTDIERDWEGGRYIYDVEVRKDHKEYDVRIDAKTGKVIFSRLDSDYVGSGQDNNINISYGRARSIALKSVGGGHVTDIERDWSYGKYVYDVEVHKGYREYTVKISAKTGKVLAKHVEYDD